MLFRTPRRAMALAVALSLTALTLAAQPPHRASADDTGAGDALALTWEQEVPDVADKPVAVSPDGSRIYVAIGSSVEAFDAVTHQPAGLVELPPASGETEAELEALSVSPTGVLYAAVRGQSSGGDLTLRLERIDFSSDSVTGQVVVPSDNGGYEFQDGRILFSSDGSRAYVFTLVNRLDVIDTATMTVVHTWIGAYDSENLASVTGGILGYWAPGTTSSTATMQYGVIDPDTGTLSRTVPAPTDGGTPYSQLDTIGSPPDGVHVVQVARETADSPRFDVLVLDSADGTVKNLGQLLPVLTPGGWSSLALSTDGSTLFAEWATDIKSPGEIDAIDLSSGAVDKVVDLPPAGIAHLYPGPGGTLLDSVFPPAGGTDATYLYQYTPEPAGTPPFLTSTAQPLIENLQVGKTATVTAGSWSSTPDSVSYQWYEDFAPIAGATGTTLVITPQLEGHRVFVVATASAAGYSDGVVTSAIGVEDWDWVEPGTLVSPVPTIAGKAAVGSKLTAEPGAWTPGTKLTYQWYEDAVPITGATQSTFVVPSALAGHTIRVDVAGTLRGYTSFDEISAATAKVPQSATFYANVLPALAGSDRYGTAIAISKASYPKSGSAKAVVIASGENFPDALSAASAAVKLGGPLLLTPHNALPSTVAAEVKRLGAKKIVMIGGTAAVSASVAASLQKIAPTVRISGADRYATSLAVAKYAFGSTSVRSVFFATGAAFPDALSAGAYAGADGMPVVLVPPIGTGLSPQLKSWLKSSHTLVFDVAGGEAAISSQMQEAIASATSDGPFTDFAGADRYDTNRRIIRQDGNPFSVATTAYVASGVNFPDALAGAAAAGLAADPLYLVESNCIPAATLSAMKTAGITTIQPLGGPAAVGSGVTHLKSCPG